MPVLAPPAISVPAPPTPPTRVDVVSFAPGAVTCAEGPIPIVAPAQPRPGLSTLFDPMPPGEAPTAVRFTFAIDDQGWPRTIRRVPSAPTSPFIDTGDLAPALAATRFPAGAPRTGCSISYAVGLAPVETTPSPTLYELASRPETAGPVWAVFERIRPAGSTCPGEPGQYRRLNLPRFERLPRTRSGSGWVFLAYDVTRAGRPIQIRILGSSGDAALDRAGLRALRANRYAPGPGYRGCTYHFYQDDPAPRPAPALPADTPADTGDQAGCAIDPRSIAGLLNGSAYPRTFQRRGIRGVAAIGYDTAPWGGIGNVTVLASEPDEAFGTAARDAFTVAQVAPSDTGRRGCVQRVRFALPGR